MQRPRRSTKLEYLDIGSSMYTRDEYADCLTKLGVIGRFLGGDRASLNALKAVEPVPKSIIDVGCGGGSLTIKIATQFPEAHILGIDIDPWAIAFTEDSLRNFNCPNVRTEWRRDRQLTDGDNSVDVIITSLVCHHLNDDDLIDFLRQSMRIARSAVVINDLHRHPLASLLFALVAPVFFRNRLIMHDGLISIKRSFSRSDWSYYLKQAGIAPSAYSIVWKWAFRWVVTISCKKS